jgi:hypothetical protein
MAIRRSGMGPARPDTGFPDPGQGDDMDTSTSPDPADAAPDDRGQRDALERSEKDATRKHPENYRDEANADKVVEIPADRTDNPIEGIDPPEGEGR